MTRGGPPAPPHIQAFKRLRLGNLILMLELVVFHLTLFMVSQQDGINKQPWKHGHSGTESHEV